MEHERKLQKLQVGGMGHNKIRAAGQFILAELTTAIIERIKGGKEINLDFLIVMDERWI